MLTLCFSLQLMNLIHNNYKHREPYPEPGKATALTPPPKKRRKSFPYFLLWIKVRWSPPPPHPSKNLLTLSSLSRPEEVERNHVKFKDLCLPLYTSKHIPNSATFPKIYLVTIWYGMSSFRDFGAYVVNTFYLLCRDFEIFCFIHSFSLLMSQCWGFLFWTN